jgi:hypothetical protein
MHHSSIRDHLAKVHPDQTHTPLQPGYLFNSQAVPEPEVFNAKGFSVNTFVSDSRKRASNEQSSPSSINNNVTNGKFKKSRLSNDNVKKEITLINATSQHYHQSGPPTAVDKSPPLMLASNVVPPPNAHHQPLSANQSISSQNQSQFNANNLYNAYTMARMFPFMYQQNPLHQQPTHSQNTSPQASSFFGILNQNLLSQYNTMQQQQQHQSRSLYSAYNVHHEQQQQQQQNIFSTLFSNQHNQHNHQNNNSSTSDEHPTNSCSNSSSSSANLSYSTSSRSSSLSPGAVPIVKDRVKEEPSIKNLPILPKKSFNIDQMLNTSPTTTATTTATSSATTVTKTTRDMDTQTDATCLNCPMCSSKCV